jgi:hypothetical protein
LREFVLYQEWLTTRPWDIMLAAGVIAVAASVPVVVAIGTWVQKRRAETGRRLPWLRKRAQAAEQARERATSLGPFDVVLWALIIAVLIAVDVIGGSRTRGASRGAG